MTRASKHGLRLEQKVPRITYSSYFWWQTACICSRIGSFTMVLWSEHRARSWTSCVFVISWQWYYERWARRHKMASAGEEQWGNLEPHTVGPNLETSETSQRRAKASSCVLMRCSPAMHAASATEIKLLFWRNKEHGWIEPGKVWKFFQGCSEVVGQQCCQSSCYL